MDKIELDLMKLKEVITRTITHPLNREGNLNLQIGDLLIDINGMLRDQTIKPIFMFKTGSESDQWRIDFRISGEGMRENPFMIVHPYEWVKGLEKQEEKIAV